MTLPDPPPGPSPMPTGPPPVHRAAKSRRTATLVAVAALLAAVTLTGVAALAVHTYRSNEARKSAAAPQQDTTQSPAAPAASPAADPSAAAGGYAVRYELLGDGTADLVSWVHNNVPTNQENVRLPWRQEERHDASYAGKGIGVTLVTQKPVKCRIFADGVLLKEQTSVTGCYVRLPAKP